MLAKSVTLLRRDSRGWWAHEDLRASGKHAEARKREIQSTRNTIRNLRDADLVGVALNGVWIHTTKGYSVSGCPEYMMDVFEVWCPDTPRVDKRNMPERQLTRYVVLAPMHGGKNEDRCGSMSHVDTGTYLAIWEALGAKVHWGKLDASKYRNSQMMWAHVFRMNGGLALPTVR